MEAGGPTETSTNVEEKVDQVDRSNLEIIETTNDQNEDAVGGTPNVEKENKMHTIRRTIGILLWIVPITFFSLALALPWSTYNPCLEAADPRGCIYDDIPCWLFSCGTTINQSEYLVSRIFAGLSMPLFLVGLVAMFLTIIKRKQSWQYLFVPFATVSALFIILSAVSFLFQMGITKSGVIVFLFSGFSLCCTACVHSAILNGIRKSIDRKQQRRMRVEGKEAGT